MGLNPKPYLREVKIDPAAVPDRDEFPFCIPSLRGFESMEFHADVTFLVGENGAGKSTLVEAIALLLGFSPEGGTKNVQFATHETTSDLHRYLKAVRSYQKPNDHYFLRAESFFNLATYMADPLRQGIMLDTYGGRDLHAQSHGESFMALLLHKLKGHGLYIFDEPEAALSPTRQLAALAAIHRLVEAESQFIIATHSPILLAYPRAQILRLDESGITQVAYEETEHYSLTKAFLNNYEGMLEELIGDGGDGK